MGPLEHPAGLIGGWKPRCVPEYLAFSKFLVLVAGVHLAIIVRTTRAHLATILVPKGKMSVGAPREWINCVFLT